MEANNLIKTQAEIKNMEIAGVVLSNLLELLRQSIVPGVNCLDLDKTAHQFILENNCQPSFLNYHGFPNTICISINSQLIHGIPQNYRLQTGDLVSIDAGCSYNGYHSDAAFSVVCGSDTSSRKIKIIEATYEALEKAIALIKPGVNLKTLAYVIENTLLKYNYFTPSDYTGHGIGKQLHEEPFVHNKTMYAQDFVLQENMTIAIEPMVLEESDEVVTADDRWTVSAKSKSSLACHAEKTVLVTAQGARILAG